MADDLDDDRCESSAAAASASETVYLTADQIEVVPDPRSPPPPEDDVHVTPTPLRQPSLSRMHSGSRMMSGHHHSTKRIATTRVEQAPAAAEEDVLLPVDDGGHAISRGPQRVLDVTKVEITQLTNIDSIAQSFDVQFLLQARAQRHHQPQQHAATRVSSGKAAHQSTHIHPPSHPSHLSCRPISKAAPTTRIYAARASSSRATRTGGRRTAPPPAGF